MGKLYIDYPFINANWALVSSTYSNEKFINDPNYKLLFTGKNKIGSKYGAYTFTSDSSNTGGGTVKYTPNFMKFGNFKWIMSYAYAPKGYLHLSRDNSNLYSTDVSVSHNPLYAYSSDDGNGIYGRDYTKIPFYSYETESTYMFAIDSLNNFFMITEKYKIDDHSIKNVSIITRKIHGGTESSPLGFYEYDDSVANSSCLQYTNLYTEDKLYNVHNIGYCSKYSLYQYTRNGYIYPDIYYCDGGLSVPPDGIVSIGASNFMRLGSNLFLRIDSN